MKLLYWPILLNIIIIFCNIRSVFARVYNDNQNAIKDINGMQYTASIVVDATNGQIVQGKNYDTLIYPASLTKMMTAYLVFDALNSNIVGLNDTVVVNNRKILLQDLLHKMIIESNNDASNILAKEIYGSVGNFVHNMNIQAQKLKMNNTHFQNPTGLFHDDHYSTARDMANLAIKLYSHFPIYSRIFNVHEYLDQDSRLKIKTTNVDRHVVNLLGSKTGYIDASGYNIALWKENNKGSKIFAVLIGAKNPEERDFIGIKLMQQQDDIYTPTSKMKYHSSIIDNVLKKILTVSSTNSELASANHHYIPRLRASKENNAVIAYNPAVSTGSNKDTQKTTDNKNHSRFWASQN